MFPEPAFSSLSGEGPDEVAGGRHSHITLVEHENPGGRVWGYVSSVNFQQKLHLQPCPAWHKLGR